MRHVFSSAAGLLTGLVVSGLPGTALALTTAETKKIAMGAYIYGYSLITTEVTRVQMTNVDKFDGLHAPMGQFANVEHWQI